MQATNVAGGNRWTVTDDAGVEHTVWAKIGATADDAIAIFSEVQTGPSAVALLPGYKAQAKAEMAQAATATEIAYLGNYSPGVLMTFARQEAAAVDYAANGDRAIAESLTVLDALIAGTSRTRAQQAARIAAKVAIMEPIGLKHARLLSVHGEAVDDATDAAGVNAALAAFRSAMTS